jgi:hypothetical protein
MGIEWANTRILNRIESDGVLHAFVIIDATKPKPGIEEIVNSSCVR